MAVYRTQVPKGIDHVRALRAWLAANPDASDQDRRVAEAELADLLDALGRPGGTATDDEQPDPRIALTLSRALLDANPAAAALVGEHVAQFGEVLPTVLLAEIARWAIDTWSGGDTAAADRVAATLGRVFARGDDTTRAVVATGFLDALPRPGEPCHDVVARLPWRLRRELRAHRRTSR